MTDTPLTPVTIEQVEEVLALAQTGDLDALQAHPAYDALRGEVERVTGINPDTPAFVEYAETAADAMALETEPSAKHT